MHLVRTTSKSKLIIELNWNESDKYFKIKRFPYISYLDCELIATQRMTDIKKQHWYIVGDNAQQIIRRKSLDEVYVMDPPVVRGKSIQVNGIKIYSSMDITRQ